MWYLFCQSLHQRAKEQLEVLTVEKDRLQDGDQKHQEINKRSQRQLRDLREEYVELQTKEGEAVQRKNDLVRMDCDC